VWKKVQSYINNCLVYLIANISVNAKEGKIQLENILQIPVHTIVVPPAERHGIVGIMPDSETTKDHSTNFLVIYLIKLYISLAISCIYLRFLIPIVFSRFA